MNAAFAVSPIATSYANTTPYLTLAEFLAAPTAVDTTSLIPNGNAAAQNQAIVDTIARASGWIDDLANQILAATVDVQQGVYRIDRDGYLNVPLHYKPILEVRGVSIGVRQSQLVALTDFSDVYVGRNTVKIPVFPLSLPVQQGLNAGWGIGGKLITQITYVNGWANTLITTTANSGATSVVVQSPLGIYAGSTLRISDGANSETVTVASTYVGGPGASTTLPLVSPLVNTHTVAAGAPISISNLPHVVKEACILLTCVLIRTRGSDAIVLDSIENPQRVSDGYGSNGVDVATATGMIRNLIRVK